MTSLREHAEMMRQYPEMEHDDPGVVGQIRVVEEAPEGGVAGS